VGYGDWLPTTDGAKIFTSFYVMFALVIAAFSLSHVFDAMRETAQDAMEEEKDICGVFEVKAKQEIRRWELIQALAYLFLCLLISTILFGATVDWDDEGIDGNGYVNGFYFSVISLTTVGFGDIYPTTAGHKAATIVLMAIGIPIFGESLSALTEYCFGESKEEQAFHVVRKGFTADKFLQMKAFGKELAKATSEAGPQGGISSSKDDNIITPFEYLSFLLVANGIVDMQLIKEAMGNFKELDRNKSGCLDVADLVRQVEDRAGETTVTSLTKASQVSPLDVQALD